jgi:hypothetical protein
MDDNWAWSYFDPYVLDGSTAICLKGWERPVVRDRGAPLLMGEVCAR